MLSTGPAPSGMRILVTLLLDTLPMLGNVLLLCFFVFFIFGIVGVQLWAGLLRNRCFLDSAFVRCAGPHLWCTALPALASHGPRIFSLDIPPFRLHRQGDAFPLL